MKSLLAISAFALATSAGAAVAAEAPRFVEETKTSGIATIYEGDYLYMAGAGVAAFDCDGDGFQELYFAGGKRAAVLYRNKSRLGGPLRFEEDKAAGLALDAVTGAYPLDVDGDGLVDLAVLRVGENLLMRGKGNCRFERANEAWGFAGGDAWTTAFSATWEKGQAWPTLAVGNFMVPDSVIMGYGDCEKNRLFRPKPAGGYGPPAALEPGYCALSMLFSDWNRDGISDLRVSNDKEFYRGGEEQLWLLPPGKPPRSFARGDGWRQVNIWGMGIASHDVTGDGRPEYYLTNMANNRFEVLADRSGKPTFEDRAARLGIAAEKPFDGKDDRPSTAWHAEFGDVNNDGLADLLVVKGKVATGPKFADVDPNNLLIQQPDGTFREGAEKAGVVSYELGRGGALVDLNLDGWLDLVVTNRHAEAQLWRSLGADGNWLRLRLGQASGNRDGIGSWIEVRSAAGVQRREVTVGGGHAGGQIGWLHFGLGEATSVEVRVEWAGSGWAPWIKLDANGYATITRGSTQAQIWRPKGER